MSGIHLSFRLGLLSLTIATASGIPITRPIKRSGCISNPLFSVSGHDSAESLGSSHHSATYVMLATILGVVSCVYNGTLTVSGTGKQALENSGVCFDARRCVQMRKEDNLGMTEAYHHDYC